MLSEFYGLMLKLIYIHLDFLLNSAEQYSKLKSTDFGKKLLTSGNEVQICSFDY